MTDRQVTIVCGPPCSGKTTYVRENMQPSDVVVDYDDIAQQLGSPRTHGHEFKYHLRVEHIIGRTCDDIASGKHQRAWVIRSLPRQHDRDALARYLDAEVVLLDQPDDVLAGRAQARPNPRQTAAAIRGWREHAESTAPLSHM